MDLNKTGVEPGGEFFSKISYFNNIKISQNNVKKKIDGKGGVKYLQRQLYSKDNTSGRD